MVWTTSDDVRLLSGLSTNDVGDDDLDDLISKSQKEVTLELSIQVIREKVEYVDSTRENDIDNSNTTFYTRNWKGNYLSDTNFDDSITTSDLTLFTVDSDSVEIESNPLTITHNESKWTVTTAPDNVDIYVTYSYSPYDMDTPNPLVKLACEYLAGAYSFMKRDGKKSTNVKFGNVSIKTNPRQSYEFFYNKYLVLIHELKISTDGGAIWGTSYELI